MGTAPARQSCPRAFHRPRSPLRRQLWPPLELLRPLHLKCLQKSTSKRLRVPSLLRTTRRRRLRHRRKPQQQHRSHLRRQQQPRRLHRTHLLRAKRRTEHRAHRRMPGRARQRQRQLEPPESRAKRHQTRGLRILPRTPWRRTPSRDREPLLPPWRVQLRTRNQRRPVRAEGPRTPRRERSRYIQWVGW